MYNKLGIKFESNLKCQIALYNDSGDWSSLNTYLKSHKDSEFKKKFPKEDSSSFYMDKDCDLIHEFDAFVKDINEILDLVSETIKKI